MDNQKPQCQHRVKNNPSFVFSSYHQCTNKASVEIDGKWYCRVHAIKRIKNIYDIHSNTIARRILAEIEADSSQTI